MSTATITPEERLTVVKHLAGGKSLEVTATLTHLDRSVVLDIGSHHGYPSVELLTRAVDLLEKKRDRETAPTEHPDPASVTRISRPVAVASTPAATGTPLTRPDEIRVLINTAKGHPSKRIQAAGDKVIDAVDRLKTLLREDQEKHAAKRQQEAEKIAARAEVERLEQQLRAAKAKLRGGTTNKKLETSPSSGDHACEHDGCDRSFASSQARAMHQRRAHEGFNPHAKAAS